MIIVFSVLTLLLLPNLLETFLYDDISVIYIMGSHRSGPDWPMRYPVSCNQLNLSNILSGKRGEYTCNFVGPEKKIFPFPKIDEYWEFDQRQMMRWPREVWTENGRAAGCWAARWHQTFTIHFHSILFPSFFFLLLFHFFIFGALVSFRTFLLLRYFRILWGLQHLRPLS